MILATEMEGVLLTPLKVFADERGFVRKMMEAKPSVGGAPPFMNVSEIYFSSVIEGAVKAWHGHREMTLNYTCVYGVITVGLCDLRVGKTFGKTATVFLADVLPNYKLLTIPPGVWNGFRMTIGSLYKWATMANAASHVHDPDEIVRIKPKDFPFDYEWGPYKVAG